MSIQYLLNSDDRASSSSVDTPSIHTNPNTMPSAAAVETAPANDDDADVSIARELQASLNRNTPRKSRPQIAPPTLPRVGSNGSDNKKTPKKTSSTNQTYAIDDFLAADGVTGHVLVRFVEGSEREWLPYVYLRWACPTLRCKAELVDKVKALLPEPIRRKYQRLEHPSIAEFHPIVPTNYIPRLDDGTPEGQHERLVYRLQGRHIMGIALLDAVRKSYAASAPDKLRALNKFVAAKKTEIALAGKNQPKLLDIMGLLLEHHDLMQRKTAYVFKSFRFLVGRPPACIEKQLRCVAEPSSDSKKRRSSDEVGASDDSKKLLTSGAEPPVDPKTDAPKTDAALMLETARTLAGMKHGAQTPNRGEEMTFVELVIPSPHVLSDDDNDCAKKGGKKRVRCWAD